jgi:hypothetical protein
VGVSTGRNLFVRITPFSSLSVADRCQGLANVMRSIRRVIELIPRVIELVEISALSPFKLLHVKKFASLNEFSTLNSSEPESSGKTTLRIQGQAYFKDENEFSDTKKLHALKKQAICIPVRIKTL